MLFFLESKCCFIVCVFFGDKNRMLIDCLISCIEVVVWNIESGVEIKCFKWVEDINFFVFFLDGNFVVIFDLKGFFLWYNVESFILVFELVFIEIFNNICGLLYIIIK